MDYQQFIYIYNLELPQDIWEKFYADAVIEISLIKFGILAPKATELLTAHFCSLWLLNSGVDETLTAYKSFQLNHEGYRIEAPDTKDNPFLSTKWGIEYQRLLKQITGASDGYVAPVATAVGFVLGGKRTLDF